MKKCAVRFVSLVLTFVFIFSSSTFITVSAPVKFHSVSSSCLAPAMSGNDVSRIKDSSSRLNLPSERFAAGGSGNRFGALNIVSDLFALSVVRVIILALVAMLLFPSQNVFAVDDETQWSEDDDRNKDNDDAQQAEVPVTVSNIDCMNMINFWATDGSSFTEKNIRLDADENPVIDISGHLSDSNGWYNAVAAQCVWNEESPRNLYSSPLVLEWTLGSTSDGHRGILVSVKDVEGNETTVELFPENFKQGDTYTSVISASKLSGSGVKIGSISQINILPDYRTSFGEDGTAVVADFSLNVNVNIGNSNLWGTTDPNAGTGDIEVVFWASEDSYFTSKQLRLDPDGGMPIMTIAGHIDDTEEWFNAISAQYKWNSENLRNLREEPLEFTWSLTSSSDEHRGILVLVEDRSGRKKTVEIFPDNFTPGRIYTGTVTHADLAGSGVDASEIMQINIVADNRGADNRTGIVADVMLSVSGDFVRPSSFMPWTPSQTSQVLELSDNHFGDISFWATDGSSFSSRQVRLDPDGGMPVLSVSGHVGADGRYYNAAATQCTWGADNMRDLNTDPIEINWSLTTDAAGQEGVIVVLKDDKGEGATVFLFPEDFKSGQTCSSVININNVDTRYTKIDLSRIVEMYIFPDHRTDADTALVSNFSLNLSGDFLAPSSALPWGVERVVDAVVSTGDYILRTMPYGDSASVAGVWVPDNVDTAKVSGDVYVQYGEENFPYARFSGSTVKNDDGTSVPVVAYFSLADGVQESYDLRAVEMSIRPSEGVNAVRIEYTDADGAVYSFVVEGLEPGVWNRIQIDGQNSGAGLIDVTNGRNISFSPVGVEGEFSIDVSMGQTDAVGFADKAVAITAAPNSRVETTVLPGANVAFIAGNANSSWTTENGFYVRTLVNAGDTLLIETSPQEVSQAMEKTGGALRFVVDYGKKMTFSVFDTSGRETSFDLTPVESPSGYWTVELSREYMDYLFAVSGRQMADPDRISRIEMTFNEKPAKGTVSVKDITESSNMVWNGYERTFAGTNDVALSGMFHFSEGVGYTVNNAQADVYQPNPGATSPDTVIDVESIGRESEVAVEFEAVINEDKLVFTFDKEGLLGFVPEDGSAVNGDIVIVISETNMSKVWNFVLHLDSIDPAQVQDFEYLAAEIDLDELGLEVPRNKSLKFQIKLKTDNTSVLGNGRLTIVELGMRLNPHANPVETSFGENVFPDEYTYLGNGTVDSRNMRLNTINTGGSNLFDESDGYVPFGGAANFDTAIRGFARIGAKGSGRDYASVYIYGSVVADYPDDSVVMAFDLSRVPEDVAVRVSITDRAGNALAVLDVDRSQGVEIGSIVRSITELGFDPKDVLVSLSVVNQGRNDYSDGFEIYLNTAFTANGIPMLASEGGSVAVTKYAGAGPEAVAVEFVVNAGVSELERSA